MTDAVTAIAALQALQHENAELRRELSELKASTGVSPAAAAGARDDVSETRTLRDEIAALEEMLADAETETNHWRERCAALASGYNDDKATHVNGDRSVSEADANTIGADLLRVGRALSEGSLDTVGALAALDAVRQRLASDVGCSEPANADSTATPPAERGASAPVSGNDVDSVLALCRALEDRARQSARSFMTTAATQMARVARNSLCVRYFHMLLKNARRRREERLRRFHLRTYLAEAIRVRSEHAQRQRYFLAWRHAVRLSSWRRGVETCFVDIASHSIGLGARAKEQYEIAEIVAVELEQAMQAHVAMWHALRRM